MRRIVWLSALLAVAVAGWVRPAPAQVAVPEIAPAGVRLFSTRRPVAPMVGIVPENPAALQWGSPSRVAAGALNGRRTEETFGALPVESSALDGTYAGFRWIRLRAALAAEAAEVAVDFPIQGTFAPHFEKEQRTVALSFSWPESLAFGLGSEQGRQSILAPPSGIVEEIESDAWSAGLSWRIGQGFFLGAAHGSEELTRVQPQPQVQRQRDTLMYGIGLRGTGWLIWHLEADYFRRDEVETPPGTPPAGFGYEMSFFNAEAIWGVWLFGYAAFEATRLDSPPGNPRVKGYTADFGLAPLPGLTITGRFESSESRTDQALLASEEIASGAVTWQF